MSGWNTSALGLVDNKIIAFPNNVNMPLVLDLSNKSTTVLDVINIDSIIPFGKIEKISHIDKYLCAVSMIGDSVFLYDTEEKEIKKIDIKIGTRSWGNYAYVLFLDGCIEFFMCEHGDLYKLDVNTKELDKTNFSDDGIVFEPWSGIVYHDEVVIISNDNQFIRYDFKRDEWRVFPIGMEMSKIIGVELIEDEVVILCIDGSCHCINLKTNIVKKNIYIGDEPVGSICKADSKYILLPSTGKEIILYDYSKGEQIIYDDYPNDFVYDLSFPGSKYCSSSYCDRGNVRFYSNVASDYILSINKKTAELQWYKIMNFSSHSKTEVLDYYCKHLSGIVQEDYIKLNDLIAYLDTL